VAKSKSVKQSAPTAKVFLIAPTASGTEAVELPDDSVETQGRVTEAVRGIFGQRQEVSVPADQVVTQIQNYVTILHTVAAEQPPKGPTSKPLRISEITLSLTLSASGNIGIASTKAEAGITIVFKRE
jgi:hypothetical protein